MQPVGLDLVEQRFQGLAVVGVALESFDGRDDK